MFGGEHIRNKRRTQRAEQTAGTSATLMRLIYHSTLVAGTVL